MRKLLSGFSLDSDHHARRFAIAPATFLFIVLFPAVGLAAFPNGTP